MESLHEQHTSYLSGRSLSPEYVYILQRKYEELYPGNNLPKPPLLLNPRLYSRSTLVSLQPFSFSTFFLTLSGPVQGTASKNASSKQGENFKRLEENSNNFLSRR
jgi:hypothetical protein